MLDTTDLSKFLKGITDALRKKKGTTDVIEHKLIDEEINNIHMGGEWNFGYPNYHFTKYDWDCFFSCYRGTSLPLVDTFGGISFICFTNSCYNLTEDIPEFDFTNGKFFNWTYSGVGVEVINVSDTPEGLCFVGMFSGCSKLKKIVGKLNFSKARRLENYEAYISTYGLPSRVITANEPLAYIFDRCVSLEEIDFVEKSIFYDIDFKSCKNLTRQSISNILCGLGVVNEKRTLTLPPFTSKNNPGSQIGMATQRGWTVVFAE